jgi:hypothetical protein
VRADSDDVPGSEDDKEEDGREVKVGHQSKDEADHTSGNEDHIRDETEDQRTLNTESQAQGIVRYSRTSPVVQRTAILTSVSKETVKKAALKASDRHP